MADQNALYFVTFQNDRVEYIHQNSVKALIADHAEEYVYSSAKDYTGRAVLVHISFRSKKFIV
jgi:hypothetical protein